MGKIKDADQRLAEACQEWASKCDPSLRRALDASFESARRLLPMRSNPDLPDARQRVTDLVASESVTKVIAAAGLSPEGGRAWVLQQFFESMNDRPEARAFFNDSFADLAHQWFSGQIAGTIELSDPDVLKEELWPSVSMWLVDSLRAGKGAPLFEFEHEEDSVDEEDGPELAKIEGEPSFVNAPFWWDTKFGFRSFFRAKCMGQFDAFKINGLISSPVGKLLRQNGLARVDFFEIGTILNCDVCGQSRSFIGEPTFSCPGCAMAPRRTVRQRWVMSLDALNSGRYIPVKKNVCSNPKCREIFQRAGVCTRCGHVTRRYHLFTSSRSIHLDAPVNEAESEEVYGDVAMKEGISVEMASNAAAAEAAVREFFVAESQSCHRTLDGRGQQREAAFIRLLTLGSIAHENPKDAFVRPLRFPEGWAAAFHQNLTEGSVKGNGEVERINTDGAILAPTYNLHRDGAWITWANYRKVTERLRARYHDYMHQDAMKPNE